MRRRRPHPGTTITARRSQDPSCGERCCLLHPRSQHQHLGLVLYRDDGWCAVAEKHVRELSLPLHSTVGLIEGDHVGIAGIGHRAQQDYRVLVKNRTATHSHVETVRDNLFPPYDLSLEIQGRDDRGTKDTVDELTIGDGRRAGVATAGAGAKIVSLPGPRWHDRAPQPFSIRDAVAGDVVVRDHTFLWLAVSRPLHSTNENRVVPDDGTGVPRTTERTLPDDILIGGTSPSERQILRLGVTEPGRAAKLRPILAAFCGKRTGKQSQRNDYRVPGIPLPMRFQTGGAGRRRSWGLSVAAGVRLKDVALAAGRENTSN